MLASKMTVSMSYAPRSPCFRWPNFSEEKTNQNYLNDLILILPLRLL